MTLKERFEYIKKYANSSNAMSSELAKECEQIADEFAIGFAEWTHNLRTDCKKGITEYSKWNNISNKELLENYKKEKGL